MANDLSLILNNELTKAENALPKAFKKDRFIHNAIAMLNSNDSLAKFVSKTNNGISQVKAGLMKAAMLNLDAMSDECYLIPYGNMLNFQTSYKGLIKLCMLYSERQILEIYAKAVKDGDQFEEKIEEGNQIINFKPKAFNNGDVLGAFAIVKFKDGGMLYDTMSAEELEYNRKTFSKVPNSPAWTKSTNEMYKKTVLRRLLKSITLNFETAEQQETFASDDFTVNKEIEEVETDVYADVIESTATEVTSDENSI